MMNDLPAFVRQQREQHGLSIREAARRAGISEGGWRLIEQGAGNHAEDTIARVQSVIAAGFPHEAPPGDRQELASLVRSKRLALGLTQEDIAAAGGPSVATIRNIENGTADCRPRTLRQLMGVLEEAELDPPASGSAFGQRVRSARLANGWTTEDAAARGGISRKTWERIEAGQSARMLSLRAVAKAFDSPAGLIARAYHGEMDLNEALTSPSRPLDPPPGDFEALALLIPKLELHELNRLSDMVSTAIAIRSGGL